MHTVSSLWLYVYIMSEVSNRSIIREGKTTECMGGRRIAPDQKEKRKWKRIG